jgi:hypothetical protein
MSTPLCAEIRTRLEMTEAESERMLGQFRSLPVDHPDRGVLLRQLEIAAEVAGELESLHLDSLRGAKGIYHQLPV